MMRYEKLLIVGLLMTAIVLVGCQPLTGDAARPGAPEAVMASAPEEASAPGPAPVAAAVGYQEGFTAQGEPFRGDPAAPVVIEEFSSYQCPFCARYFRESYPQVIANYVETGQVLYVFRDFPLPTQRQSPLAAEAANCAGQTDGGSAYWAMHDRLFEGQEEWSGKADASIIFERYAAELGLDVTAFSECLNSGATRAQVEADAAEGGTRGVRGTPTFFINGQPLVGAQPYLAIAQAIDLVLAGEALPAAESVAPDVVITPVAITPTVDDLVVGDPNASVTIVEFSDYQCPYCARHSQETWPQLKAEFVDTGRVRYVFKDLPLVNIHPQAPKAHEAARCAGEQGAYWDMHDRLFIGQAEWAGSSDHVAVLKKLASGLGLETSTFDACLDSGRWADAVNADLTEGTRLGIRGTPSFFVNGYPLVGVQPYEVFQYAIDLAEQGKLGEAYQPQSSAPPAEGTALKLAAVSELSPEIRQLPTEVQEAYRFALANPDVLSKIPCYCGCGGVGHLNNRMCYIQSENADGQVVFDSHAAG